MPSWQTTTLSPMLPLEPLEFITEARDVIEALRTIIAALIAISSAEFIKVFIDPVQAIVDALKNALKEFIDLFLGNSVYLLFIHPGLEIESYTQSTDQFLEKIANSFYDSADPNRPTITDGSAAMIVLLVGSKYLTGIFDSVEKLGKLFSHKSFENIKKKAKVLHKKSALLKDLVGSLIPQDVTIEGSTDIFSDTGILQIGAEITTYVSKTANSFKGVIVRSPHTKGVLVTVVDLEGQNKNSTTLTVAVAGLGVVETIQVENTDNFPRSGSIKINDEELAYIGKSGGTTFLSVTPTKTHKEGDLVTLVSGGSFHGGPPDWESMPLSQMFPSLDTIVKELENLSNALTAATNYAKALDDFKKALLDKIDDMLKRIDNVLEAINNLKDLLTLEIHLLITSGSGTLDGLVNSFLEAGGKPDYNKTNYTAGVAIVSVQTSGEKLTELFGE